MLRLPNNKPVKITKIILANNIKDEHSSLNMDSKFNNVQSNFVKLKKKD